MIDDWFEEEKLDFWISVILFTILTEKLLFLNLIKMQKEFFKLQRIVIQCILKKEIF